MIYLIPLFAVLFFAAFAGFFVFVFYLVLSSFYRTWEEARNNDRQPERCRAEYGGLSFNCHHSYPLFPENKDICCCHSSA